jgi:hypothetical protein
MFVNAGARVALLADERARFLSDEWPRTRATIQRLGFTADELFAPAATTESAVPPGSKK